MFYIYAWKYSAEVLPHVTGPVICLALLSTVADLALAASPQAGLPTGGDAADVVLLLDHLNSVMIGGGYTSVDLV